MILTPLAPIASANNFLAKTEPRIAEARVRRAPRAEDRAPDFLAWVDKALIMRTTAVGCRSFTPPETERVTDAGTVR